MLLLLLSSSSSSSSSFLLLFLLYHFHHICRHFVAMMISIESTLMACDSFGQISECGSLNSNSLKFLVSLVSVFKFFFFFFFSSPRGKTKNAKVLLNFVKTKTAAPPRLRNFSYNFVFSIRGIGPMPAWCVMR